MNIKISDLKPSRLDLFGATLGRTHAESLGKIVAELGNRGGFLVLSFEGIEGVTASYLKAFFESFYSSDPSDVEILALEGINADTLEDLEHFLKAKKLAMLVLGRPDASLLSDRFSLVGEIDPVINKAFEELLEFGPATALDLKERYYNDDLPHSTLNNRLAALYRLKLVARRKVGRSLVYLTINDCELWEKV